jgi:hypothetical protein
MVNKVDEDKMGEVAVAVEVDKNTREMNTREMDSEEQRDNRIEEIAQSQTVVMVDLFHVFLVVVPQQLPNPAC